MICVLPMCAPAVFAQPTQQEFEWAREDALSMMLPKGTHASYVTIKYPKMSAAEAQALLDRIGEDHTNPRWGEARETLMLDGQPLRSEFNIWYIDDTHFRVNEDTPQLAVSPTIDAVVNGNDGWIRAGNGVLTALDLRNTPRTRDSRTSKNRINVFVRYFVHAGIGLYPSRTLDSFRASADSWSAVLRNEETGAVAELSGRYITDAGQFVVDRARNVPGDDSAIPAVSIELSDYQFDHYLQSHLPTTVAVFSSDGRKSREYVREFAKHFDTRSFDEMARLPADGYTDPLRPDVELRRINDFRTSRATRTEIDPESGSSSTNPLADDRVFADNGRWDIVGWGVLLCLGVAFLFVRYRHN